MPTYLHLFRYQDTTQERTMEVEASRPCKARTIARLLLNADTQGGIGWLMVEQTIKETT
jgi:hypothetical protein